MRFLAIFPILLLLIPFSSAAVIFDDWVTNRETFKVGDDYFYAEYFESSGKLLLKVNGLGRLMEIGECEKKEKIKYCFEDIDGNEIKIKVTELEPEIEITRSFSTVKPSIDDLITVSVTIKNNGEAKAYNIKYLDVYPEGLLVYGGAGSWEGSLSAGQEKSFTYTIRAKELISFDSQAEVSYKYNGDDITTESDIVTISVQKPFYLNDTISTEAADRGDIINYTLKIGNRHSSNKLEIENLEISIPESISILNIPVGFKREDNRLIFEGELEEQETKNFTIKLKPSRVGRFKIKTSAVLEISRRKYEENLEKQFTVGLSSVVPILNVTPIVKSNSAYDLYIGIKNWAEKKINNVKISVISDLFNNITETKNIAAGQTIDIYKKTLTAPYTEEDKFFNIIITGSYTSSSGKLYTFKKSQRIKVEAVNKVIEIIRETTKKNVYEGEKIEVKVSLKNRKNTVLEGIDVVDIFPKTIRATLKGNITAFIERLEPLEEKEAYSYSVTIPKDYGEAELEFTTNVNVRLNGQLIILKKTEKINVLGKKPLEEMIEEVNQLSTNKTTNKTKKTNETDKPSKTKKEEKNLFSKILSWIKKIFLW